MNEEFLHQLIRIASAIESQNQTLKKIHVALNGISGKLTEGTREIDHIEKAVDRLGERLPFVSSAICDEIAELTTELMQMNEKEK